MLLQILGPQLSQNARRSIEPLLVEAQGRIEQMIAAQNAELSNNILPKVATSVKAVQTIKTWMESIVRASPTSVPNVNGVQAVGVLPHSYANGVHIPAGVRASVPTLGTDRIGVVPNK